MLRRDGEAKGHGQGPLRGDIRVPGMLYAKILRPPAHGAKLKSADTAPAKEIAGVQIVQDGDFVAVLHEFPDVAEAALGKIKAEFDGAGGDGERQDDFRSSAQRRPEPRVVAAGRRFGRRQKVRRQKI